MRHHVIEMAGQELKCRLTTQNIVALERKIGGRNILKVLMDDQIMSVDIVLLTLHASLQAIEHGYTMDKVYSLYDAYVESGKTYMDLLPELISVLEVSGFFTRPPQEEQKNPDQAENNITI